MFPREQLLVLDSDTLRGGRVPAAVLDVPRPARVGARRPSPTATWVPTRRPASDLEAMLREYFRPHDERLASLLGVELPWAT